MKKTILTVAGEHSGDLLCGELLQFLKSRNSDLEFIGIGGETMLKEGLQSYADIEDMAVIGFTGILSKYFKLRKLAKRLVDAAKEKNITEAILIDYPGFNLALAEMLKKAIPGFKVIFYVSPQIWAWRYNRIYKIKERVDHMLLLFQFEKKIYDRHEIRNTVVGHPLVNRIQTELQAGKELSLPKRDFTVCLMPGSRSGEIRRLLADMLASASEIRKRLSAENKSVLFLVPSISEKEEKYILDSIEEIRKENPELEIQYHYKNTLRCIEKSDMVILASGTATLEVACFEKPMVILYKNSMFTHWLGKKLVLIPYVGLVNVLSERFICREFLQEDCNPQNITEESMKILRDEAYRKKMTEDIILVKKSLGDGKASEIAGNSILELISSPLRS
ncbi:MAG TPA: lipid-A-disaccharide synthase [Leptospiraceae bacterium]|nr:lipid-A-disaccharide synthase [Leptospiraceae bacterium]